MNTIATIKSKSVPDIAIHEWDDITKDFQNAKDVKAVVWYYNKIDFYEFSNGNKIDFDRIIDDIVRLRIFNAKQELHIWRSHGVLKGRFRTDEDENGDQIEYVHAQQIMNGTLFKTEGNFLRVTEEKGIDYQLSFPELLNKDNEINRLVLITRNYIDYNTVGQAGYVDCRFENITFI